MSVESLAIALHHSKASGAARLVLVGIANHDGDGGAWPSIATLAKYAAITPRNVKKHIQTLVDLGEIVRHQQQGGTRTTPDWSRPNLYEFKLTCPPACDRTKNHRIPQIVDKSREGVSVATPGVGSDTPPGVGSDTPPVSVATPEPSYEPSIELTGLPSVSTSPALGAICWACGNQHATEAKYCTACTSNGMDSPWIACTGCGGLRKRNVPGQQSFTCKDCQP